MNEKIRCFACRGSKKVSGLGGITVDCETCKAEGFINVEDKPKKAEPEPIEAKASEVIEQVAKAVSVVVEDKPEKIDGKKAIFRKKRSA